jgi:hypothetical protein
MWDSRLLARERTRKHNQTRLPCAPVALRHRSSLDSIDDIEMISAFGKSVIEERISMSLSTTIL